MGFIQDEVEAAANSPPFALEDGPGDVNGAGNLIRRGWAAAGLGGEVRVFVFDEGANQTEVVAGGGVDAMLAVCIPAGDAVLEFGGAVEVDFLGALDGPVLEVAVAAGTGVALDGGRVGAAALAGARHDAGVGAEGVQFAEVFGIAQFAGEACGENKADAGNAC